ncbi:MAG TPA: SCO family protein [Usitatibacter sp.]|nr:SCO family protein [Usitatibacter sp.]
MKSVAFLAALLAAAVIAQPVRAAEGTLRAGVFDPPRAAPDFSLTGSDGNELKLSRYHGKVVLLGFGYSHCAAVCPTTLATLAQARRKLGATGKDLQVVYVTVDPERDGPVQLHDFLATFDPSFIGGTGTPRALAAVRQGYGITSTKVANGFDHSSFVYLIDREGRIRALMPYGHGADDYAHDAAILLRE